MEKKLYMTPVTKALKLESMNMLAASAPSVSKSPARQDLEVLSNKDVWSDGLW